MLLDQVINFVIRPPRAEYDVGTDLIGPRFSIKGRNYIRNDIQLVNQRGETLECSHYKPATPLPGEPQLPCVVYCHGNSGCRADANEIVHVLLPSNITVFCLDFSGSGHSTGEYITLGVREKDDLMSVVDYLRAEEGVSKIALWGRSMGAVTCLRYGVADPSIAGLVLDSPFCRLTDLMLELTDTYGVRVPRSMLKLAVSYLRRQILKRAEFDIYDLDQAEVAKRCFIPALFGHATEDNFIDMHHSEDIRDAYGGDKNLVKFDGDHNSARPSFYYDSVCIFFFNVLNPPSARPPEAYAREAMEFTRMPRPETRPYAGEQGSQAQEDFLLELAMLQESGGSDRSPSDRGSPIMTRNPSDSIIHYAGEREQVLSPRHSVGANGPRTTRIGSISGLPTAVSIAAAAAAATAAAASAASGRRPSPWADRGTFAPEPSDAGLEEQVGAG
eukprot:jgi/Mesvir1/28328/Mv18078-RA.2